MHPFRPDLLPPEETAIAVMDQHDDRRIGAREMLRVAFLVGAAPDMTRLLRPGRRAAHAAEAVTAVPIEEAARIGHERAVAVADQRADAPEIGEFRWRPRADRFERRVQSGQVAREISAVIDLTEEDFEPGIAEELVARQKAGARRRAVPRREDEVLRAPHRHDEARGMAEPRRQPIMVLPPARRAVVAAGGVVIGFLRHSSGLSHLGGILLRRRVDAEELAQRYRRGRSPA